MVRALDQTLPVYFGVFLGVGSFVAVDWLDALNDCDRWLLAGRAFLLLPAALILADANRRRAVAGDETHATICGLAAFALPLVAMASLRGGDGNTAPDAVIALLHAFFAVILLGVTSSKRIKAPLAAVRTARGCAMVAVLIYVARLETFNFVTYVVAVAACVAGVVGAGSSDELGYDTVLGACALLLVAAIAFPVKATVGAGRPRSSVRPIPSLRCYRPWSCSTSYNKRSGRLKREHSYSRIWPARRSY